MIEVPFVLTRPNFVDIMSGIMTFNDEQEYTTWMRDYMDKFRICSDIASKKITLINFE